MQSRHTWAVAARALVIGLFVVLQSLHVSAAVERYVVAFSSAPIVAPGMLPGGPCNRAFTNHTNCSGGWRSLNYLIRGFKAKGENVSSIFNLDRESAFANLHPLKWEVNAELADKFDVTYYTAPLSLFDDRQRDFPKLRRGRFRYVVGNAVVRPSSKWFGFQTREFIESGVGTVIVTATSSQESSAVMATVRAGLDALCANPAVRVRVISFTDNEKTPLNIVAQQLSNSSCKPHVIMDNTQLFSVNREPSGVLTVGFPVNPAVLCRLEITMNETNIDILPKNFVLASVPCPDEICQQQYNVLAPAVALAVGDSGNPVIGYTTKMPSSFFPNISTKVCHTTDCPAGQLMTDALQWSLDTDIALSSSGGYRSPGWPEGAMRASHLWILYPFGTHVCTGTLLGLSIVELLAASLNGLGQPDRLLQFAGMRVSYRSVVGKTERLLVGVEIMNRSTNTYEPVRRFQKYTYATDSFACLSFEAVFTKILEGRYEGERGTRNELVATFLHTETVRFLKAKSSLATPYNVSQGGRLLDATNSPQQVMRWTMNQSDCTPSFVWHKDLGSCLPCPSGYTSVAMADKCEPVIPSQSQAVLPEWGIALAALFFVGFIGAMVFVVRTLFFRHRGAPKNGSATTVLLVTVKSLISVDSSAVASQVDDIIRRQANHFGLYMCPAFCQVYCLASSATPATVMRCAIAIHQDVLALGNSASTVVPLSGSHTTNAGSSKSYYGAFLASSAIHHGMCAAKYLPQEERWRVEGPMVVAAAHMLDYAEEGQIVVSQDAFGLVKKSGSDDNATEVDGVAFTRESGATHAPTTGAGQRQSQSTFGSETHVAAAVTDGGVSGSTGSLSDGSGWVGVGGANPIVAGAPDLVLFSARLLDADATAYLEERRRADADSDDIHVGDAVNDSFVRDQLAHPRVRQSIESNWISSAFDFISRGGLSDNIFTARRATVVCLEVAHRDVDPESFDNPGKQIASSEVVARLLEMAGTVAEECRGTVTEARWNGVTILFNAFGAVPRHESLAVKCAMQILSTWRAELGVTGAWAAIDVGNMTVGVAASMDCRTRVGTGEPEAVCRKLLALAREVNTVPLLCSDRVAHALPQELVAVPFDVVKYAAATNSSDRSRSSRTSGTQTVYTVARADSHPAKILKELKRVFFHAMRNQFQAALLAIVDVERDIGGSAEENASASDGASVPLRDLLSHLRSRLSQQQGHEQQADGLPLGPSSPARGGGAVAARFVLVERPAWGRVSLHADDDRHGRLGGLPATPKTGRAGGHEGERRMSFEGSMSAIATGAPTGAISPLAAAAQQASDSANHSESSNPSNPGTAAPPPLRTTRSFVGTPRLDHAVVRDALAERQHGGRGTAGSTTVSSPSNDADKNAPSEAEPGDEMFFQMYLSNNHLSNASDTSPIALGELEKSFVDVSGDRWTRSTEPVGRGAFSAVYMGLNDRGTPAAIKLLVIRTGHAAEASAVIEDEIRTLSTVRHENIVTYYSVGVLHRHVAIITEYFPGGTLRQFLSQFESVPVDLVRRYCKDVLRGLAFLHEQGIVHCDVKSENVLVSQDGLCKLSDFGSSVVEKFTQSINDVNELRGTVRYVAPEVYAGHRPTTASDMWSFGVTLYELAFKDHPFLPKQGSSAMEMRQAMKRVSELAASDETWIVAPSPAPSWMSSADVTLLLRCVNDCCRKEGSDRQTAAQLMHHEFFL